MTPQTLSTTDNNKAFSKGTSEKVDSVAIFAKACFGHPSPSKRQKLNATS